MLLALLDREKVDGLVLEDLTFLNLPQQRVENLERLIGRHWEAMSLGGCSRIVLGTKRRQVRVDYLALASRSSTSRV